VANAATLNVHCGQKEGITSIGAAIKLLQAHPLLDDSNTITVTGNCQENVVIQGLGRLTLNAVNGASITDASGGATDVLQVINASIADVEGFTLNGSVGCYSGSHCTFGSNIFQGSPGDGVLVTRSYADLFGDLIQHCNGRGLVANAGSIVRTIDLKVQNCGAGATVIDGGNLTVFATNGSSFVNNSGDGIQGLAHSTLRINDGVVIQANTGHGIRVESASEASLGSLAINNNGGDGVSIGDLAFVWFRGAAIVTGNLSGTDVDCRPQFSATRGAVGNIGGGTTNCVEP
jgi:hypothetical protein